MNSKIFGGFKELINPEYMFNKILNKDLKEASKLAKGTLLDVGCGKKPYKGLFENKVDCYVGTDLPSTPYGNSENVEFEPSEYAVSVAPKKGLKVIQGDLLTTNFSEAVFDIILMHDVVEYLLDPKTDIAKTYTLVRPGGLFFVETGNISSLKARIYHEKYQFIWPEGTLLLHP